MADADAGASIAPGAISLAPYTSIQPPDPMKTFGEIAGAAGAITGVQVRQRELQAQKAAAAAAAAATDRATGQMDYQKFGAAAAADPSGLISQGGVALGLIAPGVAGTLSDNQTKLINAQKAALGVMAQYVAPAVYDPTKTFEDRQRILTKAVTNYLQIGGDPRIAKQLTEEIATDKDGNALAQTGRNIQNMGLPADVLKTVQKWQSGGREVAGETGQTGLQLQGGAYPNPVAQPPPGSVPASGAPPVPIWRARSEGGPGQPAMVPASPALPPPAAPAEPVSAPRVGATSSPSEIEASKGEGDRYSALQAAAGGVAQRKAILSNILNDVSGTISGPGSDQLYAMRGTLQTIKNQLTGSPDQAPSVTDYQMLVKQTADYVRQLNGVAGAGGLPDTDMARIQAAMSNADPAKMGNDAINYVVHLAQGAEDGLALLSKKALANGPVGFDNLRSGFNEHYDSRVMALPYMSRVEQGEMIRKMRKNKADYQKFRDDTIYAAQQGWIKNGVFAP